MNIEEKMKLTKTQLEYAHMIKKYGFLLLSESAEYAITSLHNRKLGKSSFDALVNNGLIECIATYDPYGNRSVIKSVWKYTGKEFE